jgi:hypothetical protein
MAMCDDVETCESPSCPIYRSTFRCRCTSEECCENCFWRSERTEGEMVACIVFPRATFTTGGRW